MKKCPKCGAEIEIYYQAYECIDDVIAIGEYCINEECDYKREY